MRHSSAFYGNPDDETFDSGGYYQWRKNGEYHMYNPETIHKLQYSCKTGNYNLFKEYSELINNQTQTYVHPRGLMKFKPTSSYLN